MVQLEMPSETPGLLRQTQEAPRHTSEMHVGPEEAGRVGTLTPGGAETHWSLTQGGARAQRCPRE